jgi:hypothetical protein
MPAAAFVLAMIVVQCFGALPASAAVPLPIVAVLPGVERTTLVVDLGAGAGPIGGKAVTVTVGGAPQPATVTPVISDRLAVALLVDASEAGAATLPAWLSAAARFILEVPAETVAAAVADTSPPAVLAPAQRGPMGVVRALSAVQAGGQRRTSAALDLAMKQFGATATGPRVVVCYTSSADAGGESATALAARVNRAGTILVVVGTAASTYWADAARATGGFFAPAGTPVVVPALDQVETTLRGRYLVQFPTPRARPARASVRIDTGSLALTGDVVIPAEADTLARPSRTSGLATGAVWWVLAGGLAVLAAATWFLAHRSGRLRPNRPDPPAPPVPTPSVARGRATVRPAVARGRSPVPGSRPDRPPSTPP